MAIEIFTDGSSLGNPGKGGWSMVVIDSGSPMDEPKIIHELSGGAPHVTNNRMEAYAFIMAMSYVIEHQIRDVVIKSDSNLTVQSFNEWMHNWKKKGILHEKANSDLWEWIWNANNDHSHLRIKAEWVKAHCGIEFNERADFLCTLAAKSQ